MAPPQQAQPRALDLASAALRHWRGTVVGTGLSAHCLRWWAEESDCPCFIEDIKSCGFSKHVWSLDVPFLRKKACCNLKHVSESLIAQQLFLLSFLFIIYSKLSLKKRFWCTKGFNYNVLKEGYKYLTTANIWPKYLMDLFALWQCLMLCSRLPSESCRLKRTEMLEAFRRVNSGCSLSEVNCSAQNSLCFFFL